MKKLFHGFILFFLIFLCNSFSSNLEKVVLQLEWKHQFEFAGFYAAIEKGYYKDVGLDVEIKEFENNLNIVKEVLNGNATFGISSSALILESLNKKPVVLIASYFKQNALALVSKPEIKTPADLKNKNIMALQWELEHTSLGAMLKDFGINKKNYNLIEHNFNIDKFVSGEVDAMSIFITSQLFELDRLGIKYNVLNPSNYGIFSYDMELFTSQKNIDLNPKKVKDFVLATNKGWEYAFKNKNEIIDLIYNKYSKRKTKESLLFEAEQTEKIFKTNIFKIGSVATELIKLNADMYINLGLVNKDYNIHDLSRNYYYDVNKELENNFTKEELDYLKSTPILKVHNELNWPPFNYNVNGKAFGYSIDYMNLLASKIGIKVDYISGYSWNDFLKMLENDEIDVMLNIAKTQAREKYFNFTTPYKNSIDAVFTKNNINNLNSLDDFNGKSLAVIKGFYEEVLSNFYKDIKLVFVENSIDGLKKVAFNEVDGFIDNFTVANYFIENNHITNLKPAFELKDEKFNLQMSLATNKTNVNLINILEKAKNQITQEELFELKRKWISTEENKNNKIIPLEIEQKNYLKDKKYITMCVDPDWEPFEMIDENNQHKGIAADIINLISQKIDIPIKLVPTNSWKESLKYSKEKKCDILSFLNETPQRKEWLTFTNPIFEDPNVIIARNEFSMITNLSTLKNKTIAIPKGTAMYELFEKEFPNLKIIPVESEKEAFTLVNNKEADMTIRSLIIASHTIKKENLFNLKVVSQPSKYKNILRIGVLKEKEILKNILNKAINTITKEEEKKIINKYIAIEIPNNNENLTTFIYSMAIILFLIFITLLWNYQLRKKISIEIKKNLQQQDLMFQQNKKAELGNLIGNISHQWRDSLTKISYINLNLRVRILQNKEIPEDFLDKSTLEIENSLDFMSETMQNFLDYYKPSTNILEFEIYDSIKSALSIIDTKIKNNNFEIKFKGDFSIKITGIRNEWMQVWINLIINSINIAVNRNIKNPKITVSLNKKEIIFQDNCGNIDPQLLKEINNEQYKGIGIKMSKQIASKNGKNMIIMNGKQGAIFRFINS